MDYSRPRRFAGDLSCLSIDHLFTAVGEPAGEDLVDTEHWAVLLCQEERMFDAETGEPVDDDDVDYSTRWQPSQPAREGMRRYSDVVERWVVAADWHCLDYEAVGLIPAPGVTGWATAAAGVFPIGLLTLTFSIVGDPVPIAGITFGVESPGADSPGITPMGTVGVTGAAGADPKWWVRGVSARGTGGEGT